jgi:hypothetical protein
MASLIILSVVVVLGLFALAFRKRKRARVVEQEQL